jgi:hypothetical protein
LTLSERPLAAAGRSGAGFLGAGFDLSWKAADRVRERQNSHPPRAAMSQATPLAVHDFASADLTAALEFLKRTRSELRSLRKVHVWPDRVQVFDVNGDYFEILGLGYGQPDIIPVLRFVNTAFKPEAIHNPTDRPYKEFLTGRRHAWAEDRVM